MKYRANLSVQSPTRKKVNGKEYLVLPTVAVQEQVLNGELLPAEEIERNLMLWNAVPVTWNHPTVNNQQTTIRKANYHEWAVGQFLNVDMVEDKMRGESWIEIGTAEQKEQGEEILNQAANGEMLEVSTGYFADTIDEQGTFEGEKYNAIQQNIIPDHLALLPNAEGACSVEDGCGTGRTNSESDCQELKTQNDTSENNNSEVDGMDSNGFESFAKHLQDFFQSDSDDCEETEDIDNDEEQAEETQESEGVSEDMAENEAEEETGESVENEQDEQEEEKACIENVAEAHDLEANEVEEAIESYKERLQEKEEKRNELVEELGESDNCKLNSSELDALELEQLEKLNESFEENDEDVDYSGKNVNSNEKEADGVPEMPSVQSD